MRYRLLSKSFSLNGPAILVFTQKMGDYDETGPTTIRIRGFMKTGSFLLGAGWASVFVFEYERGALKSIDGVPLGEIIDLDREFEIEYEYAEPIFPRRLETESAAADDVLEAEIIE